MPTTNIFIIRHGQTEFNRTARIQGRGINKSLNRTGREQARSAGHALKDAGMEHIFSSSLKRSVETAEIIANVLKLPTESYAELDEMDFGVMEGKPLSEIEDELSNLRDMWKGGNTAFAVEQGESPDAVLERVLVRLDVLLEQHRGQNILLVLHGRLIRILLAHWLGYGLSEMYRIAHQNGALYHLQLREDDRIESVFMNKTGHLIKET